MKIGCENCALLEFVKSDAAISTMFANFMAGKRVENKDAACQIAATTVDTSKINFGGVCNPQIAGCHLQPDGSNTIRAHSIHT